MQINERSKVKMYKSNERQNNLLPNSPNDPDPFRVVLASESSPAGRS